MNQASAPRAGTERAHFRELLVNLSLPAAVVIVLLAACEMFLRFSEPGYLSLDMNIFQFDRDGILDLKPNAIRQHRTSEWDVRVITNAEVCATVRLPCQLTAEQFLASARPDRPATTDLVQLV